MATLKQERQYIRVEGDLAEVVSETIVKQVPIETLQKTLVEMMPKQTVAMETPCLPKGTRFYVATGGYEYFVIEQEPRKRVMLTGPDVALGFFNKKATNLFAMPYVVFVIQVPANAKQVTPGFRVFFSKEPLRTMDDKLLIAPLPNLDNRGTICVGSTPAAVGQHTVEAVEEVIVNFWGSSFRYGGQSVFPGVYPNNKRPGLFDNWGSHGDGADFKKWVELTKAGGDLAGLEIGWEPSQHTVREAIENPQKGIGE